VDLLSNRALALLPLLLAGALGLAVAQGSGRTASGATAATQTAPGSATTAVTKPALVFDASTPVTFETRGDEHSLARTVIIKNETDKEQTGELSVRLVDRTGAHVEAAITAVPSDLRFSAYDMRPVSLRVSLVRASGQAAEDLPPGEGWITLKTKGQSGAGTLRAFKVLKPLPAELQSSVIFGALALAVILIVLEYLSFAKLKLSNRMGTPEWSKSWASKATVGAAFLTTVMSLVGDQTSLMHKTGYIVTAALLTAVAALAPIAYAVTQRPVVLDGGAIEHQGFVFTLLAASVLSLWAAFGQLALLIFALEELAGFQVLSEPTAWLFQGLVVALAIALILYSANAIGQLLAAEPPPVEPESKPPAEQDLTTKAKRPPSKPEWRPI